MPSTRNVAVSLLIGLIHAAALLLVATQLGYSVGPGDYSLVGMGWRYGGLAVVAAVPVWLALRYTLVTPLCALVLTTGYVLGMELSPPGPTFRDVAELERLAEPTGIIVVENGLYIVRYMINASVWTLGFVFFGLIEYVCRLSWDWLPSMPTPLQWVTLPASRQQATTIATAGGLLHAGVMVWFAVRLGVTATGGFQFLLYLFSTVGMWLLAAVPLYLLVRHLLVSPPTLLAVFVLLDVRAEFVASVDDPHAFYFGAWFVFLGVILVAGTIEFGLRRLDLLGRVQSIG